MSKKWDWELTPQTSWFGSNLSELVAYKDLLFGMVRKDFLASYQQTLLGPLWIILHPLLTVVTYVLVFSKLIGLSTEGVPSFLYYLTGITLWNLFAEMFMNIANSFGKNVGLFQKVYFPRIIVPLSNALLSLSRLGIQLVFLFIVLAVMYLFYDMPVDLSAVLLFVPVLIVVAGIAFGMGLIFSMITIKYKDIIGLMQLMVRLLMFVCPIFYSLSMVPDKYKWAVNINPLAPMFELFRFAFLGKGVIAMEGIVYSVVFMILCVVAGIGLFNKMNDKLIEVA
jgi:lipopolysaccharide transport system permease protein